MSDKPITLAMTERLEAIAAKATPGPWESDDTSTVRPVGSEWIVAEVLGGGAGVKEMRPNADFIAESRTALPALIAQHKSAMELIERLKRWGVPAGLLGLTDPEFHKDHAEAAEMIRNWKEKT